MERGTVGNTCSQEQRPPAKRARGWVPKVTPELSCEEWRWSWNISKETYEQDRKIEAVSKLNPWHFSFSSSSEIFPSTMPSRSSDFWKPKPRTALSSLRARTTFHPGHSALRELSRVWWSSSLGRSHRNGKKCSKNIIPLRILTYYPSTNVLESSSWLHYGECIKERNRNCWEDRASDTDGGLDWGS